MKEIKLYLKRTYQVQDFSKKNPKLTSHDQKKKES